MFVYVTLQQLPESKQLKSQVGCGEMGNRMSKRHVVNYQNSFAGITIYIQTFASGNNGDFGSTKFASNRWARPDGHGRQQGTQ